MKKKFKELTKANDKIAELEAENERLFDTLSTTETFLNDWLHEYAPEFCDPVKVAESHKRVHGRGTLAYIAMSITSIQECLSKSSGQEGN